MLVQTPFFPHTIVFVCVQPFNTVKQKWKMLRHCLGWFRLKCAYTKQTFASDGYSCIYLLEPCVLLCCIVGSGQFHRIGGAVRTTRRHVPHDSGLRPGQPGANQGCAVSEAQAPWRRVLLRKFWLISIELINNVIISIRKIGFSSDTPRSLMLSSSFPNRCRPLFTCHSV